MDPRNKSAGRRGGRRFRCSSSDSGLRWGLRLRCRGRGKAGGSLERRPRNGTLSLADPQEAVIVDPQALPGQDHRRRRGLLDQRRAVKRRIKELAAEAAAFRAKRKSISAAPVSPISLATARKAAISRKIQEKLAARRGRPEPL